MVISTLLIGKLKCRKLGLAPVLQAMNGNQSSDFGAGDHMLLSYPHNILPPPHRVLDDPFTLPPLPQSACRVLPVPS